MNIAIIFAGGKGERLQNGTNTLPKQFLNIENKPILIHTLLRFENHKEIDKIYLAILPEYKTYTEELIKKYRLHKIAAVVDGGDFAQESIYNAISAAANENPRESIVLIHDGVRPVITDKVISGNIKSVKEYGTAITAVPCYETILISRDGKTPEHVPVRKETFKAQAPQSFRLGAILDAHETIRKTPARYENIVDSCTLFHKLGKQTHLVEGNFGNIKVTTVEDLYLLKGIMLFNKEVRDVSV